MRRRLFAAVACLAAIAAGSGPAIAQEQTATQFYTTYRAAFDKANSVDELLPYMSAERRKQVEATEPEMRKKMFGAMKAMGTYTSLKIVKETRSDSGATLAVEAVDTDKAKVTGTITLVKENGAWKVSKESFKSS
jgi:hypothetical protein